MKRLEIPERNTLPRGPSKLEADVLLRAVQMFVRDELVVADSKVLFRPGRLA